MIRFCPLAIAAAVLASSCGTNFLGFFVYDKTNTETQLEDARTKIDDRKYSDAISILEGMDSDSNDRRALLAAARMGNAGIDVWQILSDLLDDNSSLSGMDDFFDTVGTTIFGEDEVRTARITALRTIVTELLAAPDPNATRIKDLACFVAGLWTLPVVEDATSALNTAQDALSSIQPSDCSGIDDLDTSLATLSTLANDFDTILTAVNGCSIVELGEASSSLNAVEEQLSSITDNADSGCEAPTCEAGDSICQILQLECVRTVIEAGETSVAGDGEITSCELIQNCNDPSACFAQ